VLEAGVTQETAGFTLENEAVAGQVLDWVLGERSFSPSLLESIASTVIRHLA
jgi:hypothetical protein